MRDNPSALSTGWGEVKSGGLQGHCMEEPLVRDTGWQNNPKWAVITLAEGTSEQWSLNTHLSLGF